MQNEMDYINQYNVFDYNYDFLKDSYSSKYNHIIDSIYICSNTCMNNLQLKNRYHHLQHF